MCWFSRFSSQGLKKGCDIFVYTYESLTVQHIAPMELGKHGFLWVKILNVDIPVNFVIVHFFVTDKQIINDWNECLCSELNKMVNFAIFSGEGILIMEDLRFT